MSAKSIIALLVLCGLAVAGIVPYDVLEDQLNAVVGENFSRADATVSTSSEDDAAGNLRSTKSSTDNLPVSTGDFDFWVLALSWSPSYCASEGEKASRRQCGRGGPKGFVVHGLWPQYEGGKYPSNCQSSEPGRISQQVYAGISDLIPTIGLAGHEWRKHGTCTELSPTDYFRVTRAAFEKIRMPTRLGGGAVSPAEAEEAFIRLNRGLNRNGIAVTCDRRYVRDVRICMDKSLNFIACPAVDRRACNMKQALMPKRG
nr:ribonuclease T2 [Notoacmeibacter sp. MSK16QG-6]